MATVSEKVMLSLRVRPEVKEGLRELTEIRCRETGLRLSQTQVLEWAIAEMLRAKKP